MNRKPFTMMLTLLVGMAFNGVTQAAVIVYDNSYSYVTAFLGFVGDTNPGPTEGGDQVTLAGTERRITDIAIALAMNVPTASADVRIKFYSNDGIGGTPSTVLWDSGLYDDVTFSYSRRYIFGVPEVLVPDTFTWTVTLSDWKGPAGDYALGPWIWDPPTVGSSSSEFYWYHDSDTSTWVKASVGGPGLPSNFGAALWAISVPEPATLALFGLGLAGLGAVRRKKLAA